MFFWRSPTSRKHKAPVSEPVRRPPLAAAAAPPVDDALAALFRRNVRVAVWLLVRLVAVALLLVLLEARLPALRSYRIAGDAIAAMLVLWPFLTAMGRNWAWRIALGRAYVREKRWADAERALRPFLRSRAQMFDATGEGAYWLGVALRAQAREHEARALFASVARYRRGAWQERARQALTDAPGDGVP